VIEGLRVLPFWQQLMSETLSDPRRDCETCMAKNDSKRRQTWGCGYEPRLPGRLGLWSPTPLVDECNEESPETRDPDPVMHCAGYTTGLNEVREVAVAHPQYLKHYLTEFLSEPPTAPTLYGHAVLERAHGLWETQRMKDLEAARGQR
jgi:hypothetical protein